MRQLPYPVPESETDRLAALAEYQLMDTPPEEEFERLANLAARVFKVPIALISLLESDRQFFKARVGLDVCETSRDVSFCAHAIMTDDILFVPDATLDPRFASNPLVLGPPFIRFYAGKPLIAPSGEKVGTLCLIDSEPRETFTVEDQKNLSDLAALVLDQMEMRRLDHMKRISQTRFQNIAATSPDAIICSNSDGLITFWNVGAERLFGYGSEEIVGQPSSIIVPDRWRDLYDSELKHLRSGEQLELANRTVELSGLHKDGRELPAEFSLSTWKEGNGASIGAIVRDTSDRRLNEERLLRLASTDVLTGLANRAVWRDRLSEVLLEGGEATVLMLDLDGFKEVNDTLGHAAGDAVLQQVAERLRTACYDAITVARLSGDEFVVLLSGNRLSEAQATVDRILKTIAEPFAFEGKRIELNVSIGMAMAPMHSAQPDELMNAADMALYRAKASGRGQFELFRPSFREAAAARRAFTRELRHAFERGEFELFYQPQVATRTGMLMGAEALLRWNHPERGLLTPVSFIDVLSQKPSAGEVGEWILRSACRQAAIWRTKFPHFRVGVNLFEAQLRNRRLVTAVEDILAETDLPAEALELEIVENILLRDNERTLQLLRDLRGLGVGLAFDDYGTGYASLSLLKRYPVSRLKIDRSFIRDVNGNSEDAAVVEAVVYLARSFGMEVIAEGVENEEQLKYLSGTDCSEVQGYLFGRPMAVADFSAAFADAKAA